MRARARSDDFPASEIRDLLKLARECSVDRLWRPHKTLQDRVVVAALDGPPGALAVPLGASVVDVDCSDLTVSAVESLAASAAIVVVAAPVDEAVLAALGASGVPTLDARPAGARRWQLLADLLTVEDRFGPFNELRVACVGEAGTAAAVLDAFAAAGAGVSVATPPGDLLPPAVMARAAAHSERSGNPIKAGHDPRAAASRAEIIYTDTWSRGEPQPGFRIDASLLSVADHRAIVLHGLTRLPGAEVDAEVATGPAWLVHNQVVNRLPAALALLHTLDAGSPGGEDM